MLKPTPALGTTRAGMVLVVALAGCAQVLGVEGWTDTGGTGGAGGAGQSSTSVASNSSQSATVGTGGGQSSSQSASVGPGGGQSSSQSATVGPGGGQSSSQSASVGSGQGGSTTGQEVCTNGADDDNDGHVDCADSDCVEVKCVPPPPGDWQGFVEIYIGSPAQVPGCGSGFMNAKNWLTGNLNAPPASCQCSCQPATGGNCIVTLPDDEFTLYNDAICTVPIVITPPPLALNACELLSSSMITRKGVSFQSYTTATGGSCSPSSFVNKPPAMFEQAGVTCEAPLTGKGCPNSTDICVPKPASPFDGAVCIYKMVPDPDAAICPMGYSKAGAFYQGIDDQRGCSTCTCGAATGQHCPMAANIYAGAGCNTFIGTVPGDGSCLPTGLANATATSYKVFVSSPVGQCPPSLSMPTGGASGTNGAVVCCM